MTLYLDTSTLVKLYIDEPGSAAIEALVEEATIVATSAIAYVEARATFARRRRERLLTRDELSLVTRRLDADWASFFVVDATDALARSAGALAETHRLRGADAIHLASFEQVLTRSSDDDVQFSCADENLSRAARKLG